MTKVSYLEAYFKFRSAENPNLRFMDFAPKTYISNGFSTESVIAHDILQKNAWDYIQTMKIKFMTYGYRKFVKTANQIEYIFALDEALNQFYYCAAVKKTGDIVYSIPITGDGKVLPIATV